MLFIYIMQIKYRKLLILFDLGISKLERLLKGFCQGLWSHAKRQYRR